VSHSDKSEYCLLRCNLQTFRRDILRLSSGSKSKLNKQKKKCAAVISMLVTVYSSILIMGTVQNYNKLYQTTRRHITDYSIPYPTSLSVYICILSRHILACNTPEASLSKFLGSENRISCALHQLSSPCRWKQATY
jgi:hypothetical protein